MLLSACIGSVSAIVLFIAPLPILAADQTVDQTLVANLKMAATMSDRLHMLSDQQLLYNFSSNPVYSWKPGSVCNANAATWPVLSTVGATVAQLNLGPCAMLAPHLHRAHNLVVAVSGTTHTYMVQENGARLVQQVLTPGMMTIFPQASVHSMYNMGASTLVPNEPVAFPDDFPGCGNNQLYSFLNDADPATLNIAQAFFMMPKDIGTQVMPFINLTGGNWTATGLRIPAIGTGSQDGFEACRQRCGLSTKAAPDGSLVV
ncbi:spherulin-1A [Fonsecaea pedrosoi]|nr:spherulin-1A [Fonsecaea pedrosoi]